MPRRPLILTLLVAVALLFPAAPAAAGPVSAHAMVHACCTPFEMKDRIFAEAKAMGATYIRADVEMTAIFERAGAPAPQPDWRGLDELIALSRKHGLPVVGIVLETPTYISTCRGRYPLAGRCAASDPAEYGRLAGEIAAHARGTIAHWEIVSEPDAEWSLRGTPEQYARMLAASYDAIKSRVPEAQVLIGGIASPSKTGWLERVFATPGAFAASKFDVANVHLRGRAGEVGGRLAAWRSFLASHGFHGPVWVTEHGYPADPAYQHDPAFTGGDPAQAAFLETSLAALAEAGAAETFVTLRDNLGGEYASEGVLRVAEAPGYPASRRPSFDAVRAFVERYLREHRSMRGGLARQAEWLADWRR